MAALVKWWMGELGEARSRQVVLRRAMFDEISKWKGECPREVADYHEWHAYRGLQQQTDWLVNPTTELAKTHLDEINKFIHNFNIIRPALAPQSIQPIQQPTHKPASSKCAPCALIKWLLEEDQRVVATK